MLEVYLHTRFGWVVRIVAPQASCLCGQQQVLGCTAQTCVQVMIVRIDCRTPSRQVWEDQDPAALQPELPRLSVMAGCSQRRVPHEICVIVTGREFVVPPGVRDSLFIVHGLHSGSECRSSPPNVAISGPRQSALEE